MEEKNVLNVKEEKHIKEEINVLNVKEDTKININDFKNEFKEELFNHMIEMENKKEEHSLQSCCGLVIDSRVVDLITKTGIIFLVLMFCLSKILFYNSTIEERSIYINITLTILGYALAKGDTKKK